MKYITVLISFLALIVALSVRTAEAGVPLNNLQGAGGIAFNPLAYPADSEGSDSHFKIGEIDVLGKPRFGFWYVNLGDVNVDWTSIGVADTFFKRLEVSYGFEAIASSSAKTIHKNNVGAKLLLLPENSFKLTFVPAVSVGSIWKHASEVATGTDASGFDVYFVATKLITQLPRPVLVSGGLLLTKGLVTGVFGFDKEWDQTFFGNIDVLPVDFVAVGFEYEQGAGFSDFKNADYWETHIAWLPNKNLSLVAAYVNAGDHKSASKVGLGDGVVVSIQYGF